MSAKVGSSTTGALSNWLEVNRSLVDREISFNHTVCFSSEVDFSRVEEVRSAASAEGWRPSYTTFVAKAVALALREFPYANRRLVPRWLPFLRKRLQTFEHCDLTVACERDVPDCAVATFIDVIRDVDRMPLAEIHAWLSALARATPENNAQWRAFSGVIQKFPAWLAKILVTLPVFVPRLWSKYRGGSVLISSPAKYGVDSVVGAWASPLGVSFGLIKKRAVVVDGCVEARPTCNLMLNFDRRVMAGAQAARFFHRIVELLETVPFA